MMKLYFFGCFLLLGQLVSAGEYNINKETDEAFDQLNHYQTIAGLGSVPIPPVILPEIRLLLGVLIGSNSIQRVGDAILRVSEEKKEVSLDIHVRQRLLAAAYGIIDFGDGEMSGLARVRNNSFHFALTMATEPHCRVTVDSYEWETLTGVSFQSTAEKYDDTDISSIYTEHVLPLANKAYNEAKSVVQEQLEKAICNYRVDFFKADHLATVFQASIPKL